MYVPRSVTCRMDEDYLNSVASTLVGVVRVAEEVEIHACDCPRNVQMEGYKHTDSTSQHILHTDVQTPPV